MWWTDWATAFVLGVVSSTHCVGMCGGIVGALTYSLAPEIRGSRSHFVLFSLHYHLGRISSYMLAGALVAGGAAVFQELAGAGSALVMRTVGAMFLVALGVYIGGWFPRFAWIESMGRPLWRWLEPIGRRLLPVRSLPQAFGFGLVWGWLPCGLVYSALVYSLSTGSVWQGMGVMLFFGLGTIPTLLLVGFMAERVSRVMANPLFRQVAGVLIVVLALVPLALVRAH
ncbi:sulfite exporter TauE/SafE family protein [Salicola sp. Rm-C-2C1-2]|uniref:sulfite exporter TauE/SafE family protein n=1 Tax=Salicola sp. Rm-C-2C1-2 TaxID=3141321 RepID=UPI0032E4F1F3